VCSRARSEGARGRLKEVRHRVERELRSASDPGSGCEDQLGDYDFPRFDLYQTNIFGLGLCARPDNDCSNACLHISKTVGRCTFSGKSSQGTSVFIQHCPSISFKLQMKRVAHVQLSQRLMDTIVRRESACESKVHIVHCQPLVVSFHFRWRHRSLSLCAKQIGSERVSFRL
jgi:hypothetical protein